MATRQDLRDRVGGALAVLSSNQSLEPPHAARIETGYLEVYDALKVPGLAVWPYDGEIPAKFMPHLIALVAKNCIRLAEYGVSDERYTRIMNDAAIAVTEIRALVNGPYLSRECPRDF